MTVIGIDPSMNSTGICINKNGKYIWKHTSRPILVEDVRNEKFIDRKKDSEKLYGAAPTSHSASVYDGCDSRNEDNLSDATGAGSDV